MTSHWNIGLIGHVSNGKTTVVRALTGVNTTRDSNSLKRNTTVLLGYAECLIWLCSRCQKVQSSGQGVEVECCDREIAEPVYQVSFVDCPGHHSLVSTMIRGSSVMDGVLVITDVTKRKLQPQTLEHLAILEVLGIRNVLVLQNKVDLTTFSEAQAHYEMLRSELRGTVAEGAPIIPISAQSKFNIDIVAEYIFRMLRRIAQTAETPEYRALSIVRSFDVNRPSTLPDDLRGGVLGVTSLGSGRFRVGDRLSIFPGLWREGKVVPLETQITSIFCGEEEQNELGGSGLFGVGTSLDPFLTKGDRLVGHLVLMKGETAPESKTSLEILFRRMKKCSDLKRGNELVIVAGNATNRGRIRTRERDRLTLTLMTPLCTLAERCLVYFEGSLVGFGEIK